MFSSKLDIRLAISVVITCVNLNKMHMHMQNLKIKRQPVHWFGLTELNENLGIMYGRNSSETMIADEFCNSQFTRNIFNLYMRRFFFGLVYVV